MNEKFKRFAFYNIFFLCAFFGMFIFLSKFSFASEALKTGIIYGYNGTIRKHEMHFQYYKSDHTCILISNNGVSENYAFYSLSQRPSDVINTYVNPQTGVGGTESFRLNWGRNNVTVDGHQFDYYVSPPPVSMNHDIITSNIPTFYSVENVYQYLYDGVEPELPYDDTLKLDSFKVTSWKIGTSQLVFRSKLEVTWSDARISNVQVRIVGTANSPATFESNVSPFKQKFYADHYVMKNGDVIHFIATPFKSNGEYGESLYYSIVYEDGLPSNWYRKLVNTPYNDNTLTIPYNNVSGQPTSVTLPVDGVTTQKVYKVNYNPVTYEYGDINLYEIYYSPVVIYPDDTPEEEIDETQEVVNNIYTTNNYYETTKNINIDFDVSFGDISGSDIQHGFDDFGDFSNGFGGFIGKLSSWVLALFPFLSPVVASAIVVVFGLIVLIAIIAFVIKIASIIADILPF